MNKFKKVFRGYDKESVDEKISSMEVELVSANNKYDRLERNAKELQSKKNELESKVKELEDKLQEAGREQQRILKELEGVNLPKDAVGTIYMKAYESGEQLALSPRSHIKELLNSISGVSSKTKREFDVFSLDFLLSAEKMQKSAEEIINYNKSVLEKIRELFEGFEKLKATYGAMDKIENSTTSDIDSIMNAYHKEVKEFVSNQSKQSTVSIINDGATKYNHNESNFFDNKESSSDLGRAEIVAEKTTVENEHAPMFLKSAMEEYTIGDFKTKKMPEENNPVDTVEETEVDLDTVETQSDFKETKESDHTEDNFQASGINRGHDIVNLLNKYHKK